MTTTTTNLKAVGFNDEQTHCDACGRVELRGTVIVVDAEELGEIGRYGTTCASRILGVKLTRSDAVRTELGRRQAVVHEITAARRELKAGRLDWARMHLSELDRFHVLHRADELAAVAALRLELAP